MENESRGATHYGTVYLPGIYLLHEYAYACLTGEVLLRFGNARSTAREENNVRGRYLAAEPTLGSRHEQALKLRNERELSGTGSGTRNLDDSPAPSVVTEHCACVRASEPRNSERGKMYIIYT